MALCLSIAGIVSPQNIESPSLNWTRTDPKKSPEGKDLSWAAVQQCTRPFSHALENIVILGQPFQNVADGTDLLCPAVLNGLGEEFHLLIQAQAIVLQQHLQASTLQNRLGYRLHGFAERLKFLVARVVEGARSPTQRSLISKCLPTLQCNPQV